jgi:hypothetical protein
LGIGTDRLYCAIFHVSPTRSSTPLPRTGPSPFDSTSSSNHATLPSALRETKRRLWGYLWLLQLAIMFSCFAFGRIVSDTSWDVSPKTFIITASIAAVFWIAFFVSLIRIRARVLIVTPGRQAQDAK